MKLIVAAAVLVCLAPTVPAQSIDARTLVSFADGNAAEPSVVGDGKGGFVVTWQARLDDGVTALRFRQIDARGHADAAGEIARGAGWFVNWADFPSLVVLDNGDWLTHWLQRAGPGYAYDIRTTRSRDHGATWSSPAVLHADGTRSEHGFVALTAIGGADARALWLDGRRTAATAGDHGHGDGGHEPGGGAMTLRAARIGREGVSDDREIDDRVCDCCQTDAVRVGNDTLVVYRDRSADEVRDVRVVRYDGRHWLASEPLFDDGWRIAGCPVNGPAIAARGQRVIAAAYSQAGDAASVRVRTSDDGGARWHAPVIVAAGSTLGRLDAAALDGQRFLVTRLDSVAEVVELRVSLHDRSGTVISEHVLRTLPQGKLVGFPRMASSGGSALIAWAEVDNGAPAVRAAMISMLDGRD